MKVGIDAMGGDVAPETPVAGAVRAARDLPIEVVLIGDQALIEGQLARYGRRPANVSVIHASETIEMDESPVAAVRKKKDSSINVGIECLRDHRVDALVSAGNTGAVACAATLLLGLLPGVERPGIGLLLPGLHGETLLIDVGANIGPKPLHLLHYALMGEAYARFVLGKMRPSVGLLNVGEEETKGTEFIRETYSLLQNAGINFIGNTEGRNIFMGQCDVIVCDGFAGNVALKTAESLAHAISTILKRSLTRGPIRRFGAWLCRDAFRGLRQEIDYAEHGGALLFGVSGVCVIAHGASTAKAIKNAIRVGYESVRNNVTRHLMEAVQPAAPVP